MSTESHANSISKRIEKKLNAPSIIDALARNLSPSDLNSLLTEVFAQRSECITPSSLFKQYSQSTYAQPATHSAAQYRALEADMLALAERNGIKGVILSPAALFGCCSAFDAVSQNKIISATRNLEVLSDATNMLALHIAQAIRNGDMSHDAWPIHVCTTHRHIRYQKFFPKGYTPHFGLFVMVSAGRAESAYAFEIAALQFHLNFYINYWKERFGETLLLRLNPRLGYKDASGFFSRVYQALQSSLPDVHMEVDDRENTTAYYKGLRVTMNTVINGQKIEIGDMGFTDWTQRLLGRSGERLLISSMALDFQLVKMGERKAGITSAIRACGT